MSGTHIVRKSFVAEKFYGRFLFQTGFSDTEIAVLFTKVSISKLQMLMKCHSHVPIQRGGGGQGVPTPPEKSQKYRAS